MGQLIEGVFHDNRSYPLEIPRFVVIKIYNYLWLTYRKKNAKLKESLISIRRCFVMCGKFFSQYQNMNLFVVSKNDELILRNKLLISWKMKQHRPVKRLSVHE